jgi:hypothetical protein
VEHGVTVRADWPEIVGRVDLIVRFKAARELSPAKRAYRWPEQPTQNEHKEVREASNTRLTRTERHSGIHTGTATKLAL